MQLEYFLERYGELKRLAAAGSFRTVRTEVFEELADVGKLLAAHKETVEASRPGHR